MTTQTIFFFSLSQSPPETTIQYLKNIIENNKLCNNLQHF